MLLTDVNFIQHSKLVEISQVASQWTFFSHWHAQLVGTLCERAAIETDGWWDDHCLQEYFCWEPALWKAENPEENLFLATWRNSNTRPHVVVLVCLNWILLKTQGCSRISVVSYKGESSINQFIYFSAFFFWRNLQLSVTFQDLGVWNFVAFRFVVCVQTTQSKIRVGSVPGTPRAPRFFGQTQLQRSVSSRISFPKRPQRKRSKCPWTWMSRTQMARKLEFQFHSNLSFVEGNKKGTLKVNAAYVCIYTHKDTMKNVDSPLIFTPSPFVFRVVLSVQPPTLKPRLSNTPNVETTAGRQEETFAHFLELVHPKLNYQHALTQQVRMVEPLREVQLQEAWWFQWFQTWKNPLKPTLWLVAVYRVDDLLAMLYFWSFVYSINSI